LFEEEEEEDMGITLEDLRGDSSSICGNFNKIKEDTTKKHMIFDGPFLTFWAYWNVKKVPDVAFLTFLKP
jgi:hypothetical protein